MLPRLFAILTFFAVVTSIVLGFWYLANPQFWTQWFTSPDSASVNTSYEELPPKVISEIDDPSRFSEVNLLQRCVVTPSGPLTALNERAIFRWRDENGVISFGDRPPASGEYELMNGRLPTRMDYFSLQLDFRNSSPVPFFQRMVGANVTAMYRVLSGLVPADYLRKVQLEVVIFPDRTNYLDYSEQVSGNRLANTGGFYTASNNEAVTYIRPNIDETLSVVQHEAQHVIMAGVFGVAPQWLNEGFAEYFEELKVNGQVTRVSFNPQWHLSARDALASGYLTSLSEFLLQSREQWNASDMEINYALGWSIVYFLMSLQEGRTVLADLLQTLSANYCETVDSLARIAQTYPGGFPGFERDFRNWLFDNSVKRDHVY